MPTIVDNPERVAAAGKAAVRIRQFYSIEELLGSIFGASEAVKALAPEIATQRITVEQAASAVEGREEELLAAAAGKSETERKANYAQAKRQDETLRQLRNEHVYEQTKLAQLEAKYAALLTEIDVHKAAMGVIQSELTAIGAYAAMQEVPHAA